MVGARHLPRLPISTDDQVDGAIVKVQPPPIGQHARLAAGHGEWSALMAASTLSGVAGVCVMRAPQAW